MRVESSVPPSLCALPRLAYGVRGGPVWSRVAGLVNRSSRHSDRHGLSLALAGSFDRARGRSGRRRDQVAVHPRGRRGALLDPPLLRTPNGLMVTRPAAPASSRIESG